MLYFIILDNCMKMIQYIPSTICPLYLCSQEYLYKSFKIINTIIHVLLLVIPRLSKDLYRVDLLEVPFNNLNNSSSSKFLLYQSFMLYNYQSQWKIYNFILNICMYYSFCIFYHFEGIHLATCQIVVHTWLIFKCKCIYHKHVF